MFVLAVIKETVKLRPSKMQHDFVSAIVLALNQKYCNKVIINVGLCVAVHDILDADDPYVYAGEASSHVRGSKQLVYQRNLLILFVGSEIQDGCI